MAGVAKSRWTAEEDDQLMTIVSMSLAKGYIMKPNVLTPAAAVDWAEVERLMSDYDRTSKQCRERWVSVLDPALNRSPWTLEEIENVYSIVEKEGTSWSRVSELLGTRRSELMIRNMYYSQQRRRARALAGGWQANTAGVTPMPDAVHKIPLDASLIANSRRSTKKSDATYRPSGQSSCHFSSKGAVTQYDERHSNSNKDAVFDNGSAEPPADGHSGSIAKPEIYSRPKRSTRGVHRAMSERYELDDILDDNSFTSDDNYDHPVYAEPAKKRPRGRPREKSHPIQGNIDVSYNAPSLQSLQGMDINVNYRTPLDPTLVASNQTSNTLEKNVVYPGMGHPMNATLIPRNDPTGYQHHSGNAVLSQDHYYGLSNNPAVGDPANYASSSNVATNKSDRSQRIKMQQKIVTSTDQTGSIVDSFLAPYSTHSSGYTGSNAEDVPLHQFMYNRTTGMHMRPQTAHTSGATLTNSSTRGLSVNKSEYPQYSDASIAPGGGASESASHSSNDPMLHTQMHSISQPKNPIIPDLRNTPRSDQNPAVEDDDDEYKGLDFGKKIGNLPGFQPMFPNAQAPYPSVPLTSYRPVHPTESLVLHANVPISPDERMLDHASPWYDYRHNPGIHPYSHPVPGHVEYYPAPGEDKCVQYQSPYAASLIQYPLRHYVMSTPNDAPTTLTPYVRAVDERNAGAAYPLPTPTVITEHVAPAKQSPSAKEPQDITPTSTFPSTMSNVALIESYTSKGIDMANEKHEKEYKAAQTESSDYGKVVANSTNSKNAPLHILPVESLSKSGSCADKSESSGVQEASINTESGTDNCNRDESLKSEPIVPQVVNNKHDEKQQGKDNNTVAMVAAAAALLESCEPAKSDSKLQDDPMDTPVSVLTSTSSTTTHTIESSSSHSSHMKTSPLNSGESSMQHVGAHYYAHPSQYALSVPEFHGRPMYSPMAPHSNSILPPQHPSYQLPPHYYNRSEYYPPESYFFPPPFAVTPYASDSARHTPLYSPSQSLEVYRAASASSSTSHSTQNSTWTKDSELEATPSSSTSQTHPTQPPVDTIGNAANQLSSVDAKRGLTPMYLYPREKYTKEGPHAGYYLPTAGEHDAKPNMHGQEVSHSMVPSMDQHLYSNSVLSSPHGPLFYSSVVPSPLSQSVSLNVKHNFEPYPSPYHPHPMVYPSYPVYPSPYSPVVPPPASSPHTSASPLRSGKSSHSSTSNVNLGSIPTSSGFLNAGAPSDSAPTTKVEGVVEWATSSSTETAQIPQNTEIDPVLGDSVTVI